MIDIKEKKTESLVIFTDKSRDLRRTTERLKEEEKKKKNERQAAALSGRRRRGTGIGSPCSNKTILLGVYRSRGYIPPATGTTAIQIYGRFDFKLKGHLSINKNA